MRNKKIYSAVVGITFLVAVIIYFNFNNQKQTFDLMRDGIITPSEITAALVQRLKATKDSEIKKKITSRLHKLHKSGKNAVPAENPERFMEALAELKMTPDGITYSKNYKTEALNAAREQINFHPDVLSKTSQQTLSWHERGPGNVSGRVQGLVVDVSDPSGNTWFAATIGGGIWKTSSAGATWEHKTPELTIYSTGAIAQSQSNPDILYVGTGMGYGRVVELVGNGIWKSIDHGETWTQLQSTANGELFEAINRIVVDPNNPDIVLVCGNDSFAHLYPKPGERRSGIFRTTNGGTTWTQVYDPDIALGTTTDNRVQQIIANPQNFNSLYAAVNEVGVIKSTDGGLTWAVSANNFALPADVGNPSRNGFGLAGISVRTELAISPTDTARLYAAVERPRGIADLYMSKNAGAGWVLVNDTGSDPNWFNNQGVSGAVQGAYTAGWFDNTISVHPFHEDTVFVGGVNIYKLAINPANNTRSSTLAAFYLAGLGVPSVHADHHDLKMIPNNANNTFRILNANDGGVSISPDGGKTWQQITGQNTVQFYSVDKKAGEDVYIGGTQDNSTWHSQPNPGQNSQWIFDFGGDGAEAVWHPENPNLIIGSQQNGSYLKSTDGGNSWSALPQARVHSASPFISKLAGSRIDPDLLFTIGFGGVNRSDDFGESWVLTPVTTNWLGYRPFDNIEMSLADPKIVWITSRLDVDPPFGGRGGIHVSRDGGLTFTDISSNFPASVTESSGLGTHPFDPATAYMLFSAPASPKVLKTTDYGQTWQDLSGFTGASKSINQSISAKGFPDVAVFTILVMPFNTDIIWVGTEIGLFVSEDGGGSWQISDSDLPTVSIFDMKIADDEVVVATYGRGIWTVSLPELQNYQRPNITLTPRLLPAFQDFGEGGLVTIPVNLRGAYDSTHVFLNGQLYAKIPENISEIDTVFSYMPTSTGPVTFSVIAYKNNELLKSAQRVYQPVSIAPAVASFDLDFNSGTFPNFIASRFSITTAAGFPDNAIHSQHPYPNQSNTFFTLTQPFILSSGTIQFDEVVLVEPGLVNDYRNPNFFDYCIVEGSVDGINWLPLVPGYDSRDNTNWLSSYNSGSNGSPGLFKTRTINIPDGLFEQQAKVFLRFRLVSDPAVAGWGWAIDNLQVQTDATDVADEGSLPDLFSLSQNYPNPFNPTTQITYTLPQTADVTLTIYNIVGQRVAVLVDKVQHARGNYSIQWNGRDMNGRAVATGTYIYRLETGNGLYSGSKKMVFLK